MQAVYTNVPYPNQQYYTQQQNYNYIPQTYNPQINTYNYNNQVYTQPYQQTMYPNSFYPNQQYYTQQQNYNIIPQKSNPPTNIQGYNNQVNIIPYIQENNTNIQNSNQQYYTQQQNYNTISQKSNPPTNTQGCNNQVNIIPYIQENNTNIQNSNQQSHNNIPQTPSVPINNQNYNNQSNITPYQQTLSMNTQALNQQFYNYSQNNTSTQQNNIVSLQIQNTPISTYNNTNQLDILEHQKNSQDYENKGVVVNCQPIVDMPNYNISFQGKTLKSLIFNPIPKGWEYCFNLLQNEILNGLNAVERQVSYNKVVLPNHEDIFRLFRLIEPQKIRVIIIGQDPYPGFVRNTSIPFADGIAFSTKRGLAPTEYPASLKMIFKELVNNYPEIVIKTPSLESWVKQGVFLMNTSLTVNSGEPDSHKDAWKPFTRSILKAITELHASFNHKLVIVYWGDKAKKFDSFVTVPAFKLYAGHPSPVNRSNSMKSANWKEDPNCFFGKDHFKQINNYFTEVKQMQIDWNLY